MTESKNSGKGDVDPTMSAFDDFQAQSKVLQETMERADAIIAISQRGLTPEMKHKLKHELPQVVSKLRQLLITQLASSGSIRQLDLFDGSYDNVYIDDALRKQLAHLRNLHIKVNTMLGTKTIRKIHGFIVDDIPNWLTIKWRHLKDNVWQLTKTGTLVGGLGAAALVGGYGGTLGFGPGMNTLGTHLGIVGSYLSSGATEIGSFLSTGAGKVTSGMSAIFGKLSNLFGGKPI